MNWNEHLTEGEQIVWQGKPAPRCYTFRNWPHSLFGLILLLSTGAWYSVGIHLEAQHQQAVYGWIPVPFLLAGLYLTVGHLLVARLEWESVYYAVSDQRVLLQRGLFKKEQLALPLDTIIWFALRPYSETLGSVSIRCQGDDRKLTLACLEHPRQMTDLLEAAMLRNGVPLQNHPEQSRS